MYFFLFARKNSLNERDSKLFVESFACLLYFFSFFFQFQLSYFGHKSDVIVKNENVAGTKVKISDSLGHFVSVVIMGE